MRRVALTLMGLLLVGTLPPGVAAAGQIRVFSIKCLYSHTKQADPIVAPGPDGTLSAHLHDFFGARTTNSDSTVESMRAGGTTCGLTADTAGYWFPTLYKDGVQVGLAQLFAYYRAPRAADVVPFPEGMGIVAGGDTRNPPMPTRAQMSLSWGCLESGPFYTQPPNCGTRKVRAHVHFPDCWTGVDLGPNDSGALAYSSNTGVCPTGYPVNLPRLTLHAVYELNDGTGATLSSDGVEPNGTQLHADFLNAWNMDVLRFLVTNCLNAARKCLSMNDSKLAAMGYVPPPPPPPTG